MLLPSSSTFRKATLCDILKLGHTVQAPLVKGLHPPLHFHQALVRLSAPSLMGTLPVNPGPDSKNHRMMSHLVADRNADALHYHARVVKAIHASRLTGSTNLHRSAERQILVCMLQARHASRTVNIMTVSKRANAPVVLGFTRRRFQSENSGDLRPERDHCPGPHRPHHLAGRVTRTL